MNLKLELPFFKIGKKEILKDIYFELKESGLVVLAGPNGSGKTTLLNLISGLYPLRKGKLILDQKIFTVPACRVLPEELILSEWKSLCVKRLVYFDCTRFEVLIDAYELREAVKLKFKKMTPGQVSAVFLLTAFSSGASLLIMDEPLAHLDPRLIEVTERELRHEVTKGKTVLLSTHCLEELGEMADRILILNKGRLIYQGNLEQVREELREVIVDNPSEEFLNQNGVLAYRRHEGGMVGLLVKQDEVGKKIPGKRYYLNLRDLFLYLVEKEKIDADYLYHK